MSLAFVFPGQGSQSVGMLKALAREEPIVRRTFEEASSAVGYDLWRLVQDGPKEALNETEKTQPAILTASVAVWRVWRNQGGPSPIVMAGHSLGEYSALVCADSLDFETAVELVQYRGRAMQEAVPVGDGAMAAIIGLEDDKVVKACEEAAEGGVLTPANFNAPGQVVIAGETTAVGRGIEKAKEMGAKRAVLLPVSAPFHCALMQSAAEAMAGKLEDTPVRVPLIPAVYTVGLRIHESPSSIRQALVKQICEPVRWAETVGVMISSGVNQIVECGPGNVLTGLNKRITRGVDVALHTVSDSESIDKAIEACWEKIRAKK